MTADPPPIDWSDVDDDQEPERQPARYDRDLDGQGLTALQRHTMTTVDVRGGYL